MRNIFRLIYIHINLLYDWLFDLRLGIKTAGVHPSGFNTKHNDNVQCKPTTYRLLQKVFRYLKIEKPDNEIFVDFGSGKGRTVCFAAQYPFRSVYGVEISPEWADMTRTNINNLRTRFVQDVKIYNEDAAEFDCSTGTVYYFFNPFGEKTFREVIQRIKVSVQSQKRKIRIVYYNPLQKEVLDEQEWLYLEEVIHKDRKVNSPINIYTNAH